MKIVPNTIHVLIIRAYIRWYTFPWASIALPVSDILPLGITFLWSGEESNSVYRIQIGHQVIQVSLVYPNGGKFPAAPCHKYQDILYVERSRKVVGTGDMPMINALTPSSSNFLNRNCKSVCMAHPLSTYVGDVRSKNRAFPERLWSIISTVWQSPDNSTTTKMSGRLTRDRIYGDTEQVLQY